MTMQNANKVIDLIAEKERRNKRDALDFLINDVIPHDVNVPEEKLSAFINAGSDAEFEKAFSEVVVASIDPDKA